MSEDLPVIYVVDDDLPVRNGLSRLLRSAGFRVELFATAAGFLARAGTAGPGCVILDVEMPGMSGLDLQQALAAADCQLPLIFITGHGDIPMSVRAIKAGAVDFLSKPFNDTDLFAAIAQALEKDQAARAGRRQNAAILNRLATLTPREREVLGEVITGKLNKQIAASLGIVEKTIKVHRARVMEKMGVQSVAELVRLAERVGLRPR